MPNRLQTTWSATRFPRLALQRHFLSDADGGLCCRSNVFVHWEVLACPAQSYEVGPSALRCASKRFCAGPMPGSPLKERGPTSTRDSFQAPWMIPGDELMTDYATATADFPRILGSASLDYESADAAFGTLSTHPNFPSHRSSVGESLSRVHRPLAQRGQRPDSRSAGRNVVSHGHGITQREERIARG